jgi:hypothetical protein
LLAEAPDDLRERLATAFGLQAIYRPDTRQATIVLTITDTTPRHRRHPRRPPHRPRHRKHPAITNRTRKPLDVSVPPHKSLRDHGRRRCVHGWVLAVAAPSEQKIRKIRELISRIKGDIAGLEPDERARIDKAVAVVRRHRSVSVGMPRLRQAAR